MLFKKVIHAIKSSSILEEKKSAASNLRRLLKSIFNLTKAQCAQGRQGIAAVVFNELSGLTGSATVRRFNKTILQTYGQVRGRQAPAGRVNETFPPREVAPFPLPPREGRGNPAPVAAGVRRFVQHRGNGGMPRQRNQMRCFICDNLGHRYQQCPRRGNAVNGQNQNQNQNRN